MLIDDNAQISKDTLDHKMMSINKIDCILRDHWNSEDDIRSDVEHRIYKGFYNKLIDFEQVFKSDIMIFDRYKASVGFYEDELWLKFSYIMLFEKTFNVNRLFQAQYSINIIARDNYAEVIYAKTKIVYFKLRI